MAKTSTDRGGIVPATDPATSASVAIRTEIATPGEILAYVQGKHVQSNVDDIRLSLALQAFAATDLDTLFTKRKPIMSKDYIGKPFTIRSFTWHKSRFDNDPEEQGNKVKFWVSIEATDLDGELVLLGTSSGQAMLGMYVANLRAEDAKTPEELARWDLTTRRFLFTRQEHPTDAGYYPIFLHFAD